MHGDPTSSVPPPPHRRLTACRPRHVAVALRPLMATAAKMRDDVDFNVAFCELVEKYPAVYDYSRPDYANRNVQDKVWREIGTKINETATDCKDRWKNIRARYARLKNAQALPSGSEAKTIRGYYLAPNLKFLDDFLKSRKPKSNLDDSDPDVEYLDYSPTTTPSSLECESFLMPSPPGSYRKRTPTLQDVNKTACEYFSQKKNLLQSTSKENIQDEDLSFLRSVLPDMKLMNTEQKRAFKMGVLNLCGQILDDNWAISRNMYPIPFTALIPHTEPTRYQSKAQHATVPATQLQIPVTRTQPTKPIQLQRQVQYAASPSSQYQIPFTRTQPTERIQLQHQAQYATSTSPEHQSLSTRTQPPERIQLQHQAQYAASTSPEYQSLSTRTQPPERIQLQHQAQYAASTSPEYQSLGNRTQPPEPTQLQHQAQYAASTSLEYQSLGTRTQPTEPTQLQHQAQYAASTSLEYQIPIGRTQPPEPIQLQHQAQYAENITTEYQNRTQIHQSIPPYSPISPASVISRPPSNNRPTELPLEDDYIYDYSIAL